MKDNKLNYSIRTSVTFVLILKEYVLYILQPAFISFCRQHNIIIGYCILFMRTDCD